MMSHAEATISNRVNCAFLPWEKAKDKREVTPSGEARLRGRERGSEESERRQSLGNFATFVSKSRPLRQETKVFRTEF